VIDSDADQVVAAPDRLVQTPLTLSPSIDVFALVDTVGTSDVDLMRITITRFTKLSRTSIGVNASHCIGESTPPFVHINGTHKVFLIPTSRLDNPPKVHEDALTILPRPRVLRPSSALRTSSDHIHSSPFHESPAPAALRSIRTTFPLGRPVDLSSLLPIHFPYDQRTIQGNPSARHRVLQHPGRTRATVETRRLDWDDR
jgi:hypothetical protein